MATRKKNDGPRPVAWFEVVGTNGDRLRSFYSRLFGWEPVEVAPGGGYGIMDAVAPGIGGGVGSREGTQGHVTIFVEVDDLEGTLREAERLGGRALPAQGRFLTSALQRAGAAPWHSHTSWTPTVTSSAFAAASQDVISAVGPHRGKP